MFEKSEVFDAVKDMVIVHYMGVGRAAEDVVMDALTEESTFELDGPWSGSDYSGGHINKSNMRSLIRDYPQYLSKHYYAYDGYGLDVDAREFFAPANREEAMDLIKILSGLRFDYPIYDEEDVYALAEELAQEAWEGYFRSELESELADKFHGAQVDLSDEETYGAVMEIYSDHSVYGEVDGYTDVVWRGAFDASILSDVMAWAIINNKVKEA